MAIYALDNLRPTIDPSARIDPNADIVGDVRVGALATICAGSVIRGDTNHIALGARVRIEQNVVIHVDPGFPAVIGDDAHIQQGCVLHGCRIEQGASLGCGVVVLNGAVVGERATIADRSVLLEGCSISANAAASGRPYKAGS